MAPSQPRGRVDGAPVSHRQHQRDSGRTQGKMRMSDFIPCFKQAFPESDTLDFESQLERRPGQQFQNLVAPRNRRCPPAAGPLPVPNESIPPSRMSTAVAFRGPSVGLLVDINCQSPPSKIKGNIGSSSTPSPSHQAVGD
jgi:hypothetical protein